MKEEALPIIKNVINRIFILGIYLLCLLSILSFSGYGITQINLGSGLLFALVCLNGIYYNKHKDVSLRITCFMASLLGAILLSAGNYIRDLDQSGVGRSFGLMDIVYAIGIAVFLYMLMHNVMYLLSEAQMRDVSTLQLSGKQCVVLTLVLVIMWLPYYLTFFPGIFGSDPIESLRMGSAGYAWTNHHPILYTAYMKLFAVLFGEMSGINGAMGMMILVQQIILAGSFAYCISFMWKRGVSRWVLLAAFLFVSVNPVIGVFSVYATKDVLFSAAVLILVIKLFQLQEYMESDETVAGGYWIQLCIVSLLVVFLRNNGSFIIVGTLVYLLVKYRKVWKQVATVFVIVAGLMILQKAVLFPMLQVREGSFAESLSIPLQQVGQAVVDDGIMTSQERAYLDELLPLERMKEVYQAGYTDPIKFDEQFDDALLNEDKAQFFKVWIGMLPDNFGSYVKAYLLQTAGYWDISQTDSLTTYGVVENELGLCQIDVVDAVCGHSLQPVIEKLILVCRKLPVLCYLTNMAMMLFGSFLSAYLMRRKKRGISWGGPLWISWGTIMIAAPASCKFRYMLPLYFALPFVMWITTRYGLRNVDSE